MNLTTALARLLIFPGLLFAVPAAWFFLWVERKAVARMQGRIGPPFMQPFFDFIKLLGKERFTVMTVVSTLLNALMNQPGFARLDFGRVKLTVAGAMALQRAVAERWRAPHGKQARRRLRAHRGLTGRVLQPGGRQRPPWHDRPALAFHPGAAGG